MKGIGRYLFSALVLLFTLSPAGQIEASSVLQVSLNQTLQASELVFEGRVISQETRISPVNGYPFTYFTFAVINVIKGNYPQKTIELGFMGGKKGGAVFKVTDMHMPEVGTKGIYFVESLSSQQVHPLYGWHQGHYLVIQTPSGGPERVVPSISKPGAMLAAPTVGQFKQQLRDMMGGGQ